MARAATPGRRPCRWSAPWQGRCSRSAADEIFRATLLSKSLLFRALRERDQGGDPRPKRPVPQLRVAGRVVGALRGRVVVPAPRPTGFFAPLYYQSLCYSVHFRSGMKGGTHDRRYQAPWRDSRDNLKGTRAARYQAPWRDSRDNLKSTGAARYQASWRDSRDHLKGTGAARYQAPWRDEIKGN